MVERDQFTDPIPLAATADTYPIECPQASGLSTTALVTPRRPADRRWLVTTPTAGDRMYRTREDARHERHDRDLALKHQRPKLSDPAGTLFGMRGLTDQDRAVLEFERQWWLRAGSKEQAIRDELDLPATVYYQRLNRLLDDPAAELADPTTVRRLRGLRETRASVRRPRRTQLRRVSSRGGNK